MTTSAMGAPGELRVRFQPLQRTLLLDELQLLRDVLQETIASGESTIRCESDRFRVRAAKRRDIETVLRLMTEVERVSEGLPFELVAEPSLLQELAKGGAICLVDLFLDALEDVQAEVDESHAKDLRHFLVALQTWVETVLETHGQPALTLPKGK